MEEKETTQKLTYEQLKQAAVQLQQRLMLAENKLRSINFAEIRLTWLFKVLEHKVDFPIEFVDKCANEIETLLTIEEDSETTSEDKAEDKV